MKPSIFFVRVLGGAFRRVADRLARRLKNNFYLYLAAVFSVLAVLDAFYLHAVVDMRHRAYDVMIRYRIVQPPADPQIVIVDINEASLAAMAADYGRWPWPRQVLGEFLQNLELQNPKAVIFDILFSDPDVFNPDSDAYFDEAVAATNNTYFPWLRLPAANDHLSEFKPAMIPGANRIEGVPESDGTIAVVLPFFKSIQAGGRLGTHNIYPDRDGIARQYRMVHDEHGWRLYSLPLRVATDLGYAPPRHKDILLNWRGKPFTYRYVSFGDLFRDMQNKDRKRPPDEFRDKIVLIGSTAPSLFDIKATSMAREFPGVEILATAIDNLKHDDFIRSPASSLPNLVIALLIIWATAIALYKDPDSDRFNSVFGLSQFGLLAFSYAMINISSYHLNLTGPVFIGFLYFSAAKVYSLVTARALERSMVAATLRDDHANGATVAVFQFNGGADPVSGLFLSRLRRQLLRLAKQPVDVDILKGRQRGMWGLLEATVILSWAYPLQDSNRRAAVESDLVQLRAEMPALIEKLRIGREFLIGDGAAMGSVGEAGSDPARAQWRELLAIALAKANESSARHSEKEHA
ncbi:MAG: CHASE2 domain-containing protein [Burkholderiales bacterium]